MTTQGVYLSSLLNAMFSLFMDSVEDEVPHSAMVELETLFDAFMEG